jgi:hypothetical protein
MESENGNYSDNFYRLRELSAQLFPILLPNFSLCLRRPALLWQRWIQES